MCRQDKENSIYSLFDPNFRARIRSEGAVEWYTAGMTVTQCHFDVRYFPFDEQQCFIHIERWRFILRINAIILTKAVGFFLQVSVHTLIFIYSHFAYVKITTKVIRLKCLLNGCLGSVSECEETMKLESGNDSVALDIFQPNEQWTIVNTWVERGSRLCASNLKFYIHFRRKPLFFLMNVVLPIIVLSAMTLTVFCMPSGSTEKVGLAVTTVLSFTVFQLVVSEILPPTSTAPFLSNNLHPVG